MTTDNCNSRIFCIQVIMILTTDVISIQHVNGSSCSQRDTAKRGNLDLWRHKKKTCLQSTSERLFEIMVTCQAENTDMTRGYTSGKTKASIKDLF